MSQVNTISETSTANRIAHYFSKAAADYTRHHAIQQTVGGQLLERLQPVAGRLLDIGCGPASFYPQLSALAAQYYGVDVAAGMLEQARRQTPVTVPLLQGSAERLPFAADQFDACFANLSLQWCARLESAIAEMQLGAGVGVGDRTADGAAGARLVVADMRQGHRQQRMQLCAREPCSQRRLRSGSPDLDRRVVRLDPVQRA